MGEARAVAVTHPEPVRNGVADLIVGLLDTASPPGVIVLLTAADAAVATLTFSNPAFAAASGGVATAAAITGDLSAAGGVAAKAELRQGDGTPIMFCSVTQTGSGGDIQLSSTTVAS